MTKEDEENLLKWLQDKDISKVMDLLMRHGNRYSRRILNSSAGSASMFQLLLCYFTLMVCGILVSIHETCSSHTQKIRLAISTYILWCTSYLWFLYWQADFSSYVGGTAFPSSTLQALMRLTLLNGAGIPPKI